MLTRTLIALAAVLSFAFCEKAQASASRTPDDLVSADVAVPAEWTAEGEQLGRDLAAAYGYGDACAGMDVIAVVASNVPMFTGNAAAIGTAFVVQPGETLRCSLAVAPSVTVDRCAYLGVYVHERLHLARNDGWHAGESETHPLGRGWYAPGCEPAPAVQPAEAAVVPAPVADERVTRAAAKRAVRALIGRRWKLAVCGSISQDGSATQVTVCARKKIRKRSGRARTVRRDYEVTRPAGALTVARGWA